MTLLVTSSIALDNSESTLLQVKCNGYRLQAIAPQTGIEKADLAQSPQGIKAAQQEWRDSCVSEAIIAANVRYVEGDEAVDLLTRSAIENMGGHAAQYATGKVINLRKRYEHVQAGGWWVSGLDPLNDWQRMEWGQFKPLKLRDRWDVPDKLIKYEAPAKQSTRAIFLDGAVDWRSVQADITTPRLWTEGAKKAGAALTADYAAIALPGVNSGYRSKDKLGNPIAPYLIPDVVAIAQSGSIHYLAFDQDEKPETRRKVAIALSRFGKLLTAAGCTVRVVQWAPAKGKGIDDLISNHGAEAFHQAIDAALPLDEWQLWQMLDNRLTIAPSIRLKTHDLTQLSPESFPDTGIIALASGKGTGKTNLIGGLIAGKDKALMAGHRICLMRNLSERCGVDYRGDVDKAGGRFIAGSAYTLRIGFCVDSLLAMSPSDFAGCDLVLDEVCQVLKHLLTSSTTNQDGKRPALLMRFRELIQAARRVILADADLDDKAIAYIQQMRSDIGQVFLVRNDYKAPGYPVRFIQSSDSSAIISEMAADLKAGKRLYIATDAKGTRLARLIEKIKAKFPYLLINSDTSGNDEQRNFLKNPGKHLSIFSIQAVIASPSAGTGLSIEGDYFDKVYGIFYGGSITDSDMSQALMRVRANIPRVVWCAKYGRCFSKAGRESSSLKLLDLLKQKTDANTLLIRSSLSELSNESLAAYDWANDPHVHYWATIEAERNRSMWNLRTSLKVRLVHEGHNLEVVELARDDAAKFLLREARKELIQENAVAVANAVNLSPTEAKALDQLEGLDEDQRLALQKWQMAEFYCLPVESVDADLVLWDNQGRRRSQLLNLEGFIHPDTAIDADARAIDRQAQWRKGRTIWDGQNAALKSHVRSQLGIDAFLESGKVWSSESLASFKEKALKLAKAIKAALNFSVKPEMAAAQILNQLLEEMGIECEADQHRKAGKRVRSYSINAMLQKLNMVVLERRKARRERLSESVTPLQYSDLVIGGCDRVEAPLIGDWRGAALSPMTQAERELAELVDRLDRGAEGWPERKIV